MADPATQPIRPENSGIQHLQAVVLALRNHFQERRDTPVVLGETPYMPMTPFEESY